MDKEKNKYRLFIDELGDANPRASQSKFYILSACSINENERKQVKIWADQIKFKYWGRTDIVFHSREIGRKEGDFAIFKSKKTFDEFLKDLENFLSHSQFKMFFVLVDKEKANEVVWDKIKVYKETSKFIIRNFLLVLLAGDSVGRIIVESATAEKDFYFHKALGSFLSSGIPELKVGYKAVQDALTSVSFVTKKNCDVEEQIADLFAYTAKCKYHKDEKNKHGAYEKMMVNLLNQKVFKNPRDAKEMKMKYFREVDSFLVLPQ